MKLICTKQKFDELVKNKVVVPHENGYALACREDLEGNSTLLHIEQVEIVDKLNTCDTTDINASSEVVKTGSVVVMPRATTKAVATKSHDIEDVYNTLRKEFPTDTMKAIFNTNGGQNLRTGAKDKVKSSISKLLNEMKAEEVIVAAKYEVYMRVKQSRAKNSDELQYMKRLAAWTNDQNNIEAMLERAHNDLEFIRYCNIELEGNAQAVNNAKRPTIA